MNLLWRVLAGLGFGLTAIPPILLAAGAIGIPLNSALMLAGMVLWFAGATPLFSRPGTGPADKKR